MSKSEFFCFPLHPYTYLDFIGETINGGNLTVKVHNLPQTISWWSHCKVVHCREIGFEAAVVDIMTWQFASAQLFPVYKAAI